MKCKLSSLTFLLLTSAALLFLRTRVLSASWSKKPMITPGVRRATVVSVNSTSPTIVLRSGKLRWQAHAAKEYTVFVKNGEEFSAIPFTTGDHVVVVSIDKDFASVNILTDVPSFAAFFGLEHIDYGGTLAQIDPPKKTLCLDGMQHPFNARLFHQEASRITLSVTARTRFWLEGKPFSTAQALSRLQVGTPLHVLVPQSNSGRFPFAYSVFDKKSWKSFASWEFRHNDKLFTHKRPTGLLPNQRTKS